jgi:adenine phosphoribosyltransferase
VDLARYIRDVPDFPKKGILFKDITPLLQDAAALKATADAMAEPWKGRGIRHVVGLESRGFLFGTMVADRLGVGFVPIRKKGKLPAATIAEEYSLEYGTDQVEIHEDAIESGQHVLIVDDLLATGGTAAAALRLVRKAGGIVDGISFLIELDFLNGREKLDGVETHVLIHYS